ncbi:hypothetical protein ACSLFT_34470 (plasmid) [Streptomyces sp. G6]
MTEPKPFLVPIRRLYGQASRLAGRTSAVIRAKTPGRPVPEPMDRAP